MIENLPPELDEVVHRFDNRLAEVRTRLIRRQAALAAAECPAPEPERERPPDHFDFDHPISSGEAYR